MGMGFEQIIELGRVSTSANLLPPTEGFVNGNDDAYRTSFDSGRLNVDLPEGSQIRMRWRADLEAENPWMGVRFRQRLARTVC